MSIIYFSNDIMTIKFYAKKWVKKVNLGRCGKVAGYFFSDPGTFGYNPKQ